MNNRATVALFGLAVSLTAAPGSQIDDPEAFVRDVYRRFAASGRQYTPPDDIYTPRLKALFVRDEQWAKGEVGCLDFIFWVNGQDYELKNVRVSVRQVAGHPDRRIVIAKFLNSGEPQEINFDFQSTGGKWLLDDARSVRAGSTERWTLSKLLMCPH
ncbi:MAG TPA: hypothetical protein VK419_10795 [Bryobacteraceae bacterium]|nr:hypothetical protein [Bryobacteraceae bacterium]